MVEALKQFAQDSRLHAYTRVLDGELKQRWVVFRGMRLQAQHDLTAFGEFDGVVQQVQQNLAQAGGIQLDPQVLVGQTLQLKRQLFCIASGRMMA